MVNHVKKKLCGNCTDCNNCDEAARIQQRIFEREVDEELQQERLTALWKRYRWLVISGIVLIVGSAVGYEAHRSWWQKVRLNESDQYESAVFNAYTGQTEQAVAQLNDLAESGQTGYRYLAQMEAAGILSAMDQQEEALAILQNVMNDTQAPKPLRSAATLGFVGYQAETGNPAELQKLLAPLMTDTDQAFAASAAELSALLSLRAGDKEAAIRTAERALASGKAALPTRERLSYLLAEARK